MSLIRWTPPPSIMLMREKWNEMFEDLFGHEPGKGEIVKQIWAPRIDLVEAEKEYRLTADLPGVKKDDVQITLNDNVLTIQGERKLEREKKNENYHVTERAHGKFSRSITLQNVNTKKIDAKFDNGVLTISLPKIEQVKPQTIEIKTS